MPLLSSLYVGLRSSKEEGNVESLNCPDSQFLVLGKKLIE
jgi:hypothetical protein